MMVTGSESASLGFPFTLAPVTNVRQDGKPVAAQLVAISTQNSTLDQQQIKIWLGNDESRVPVRFSIGRYQADLVSVAKIQAK